MSQYEVQYYVQGCGTFTETVASMSEYNVRRLIEAKYPGVYVRVIYVREIH